mgnify:CR=1
MPKDPKAQEEPAEQDLESRIAGANAGEPISPSEWRNISDEIISETGLSESSLARLRGHADYMEAWHRGHQNPTSSEGGVGYAQPRPESYYPPSTQAFLDPTLIPPLANPPSETPQERAREIGRLAEGGTYAFLQGHGQGKFAPRELGRLEGQLAAIERDLRGEKLSYGQRQQLEREAAAIEALRAEAVRQTPEAARRKE